MPKRKIRAQRMYARGDFVIKHKKWEDLLCISDINGVKRPFQTNFGLVSSTWTVFSNIRALENQRQILARKIQEKLSKREKIPALINFP